MMDETQKKSSIVINHIDIHSMEKCPLIKKNPIHVPFLLVSFNIRLFQHQSQGAVPSTRRLGSEHCVAQQELGN